MKTIVHKSVIPIYLSAAVWLIASLFLPMYRLWHYLLYAVIAIGVYFAGQRFFPGTTEEVETAPDTGNRTADEQLTIGRQLQKEMRSLSAKVQNSNVKASCRRLDELCGKILSAVEEDTDRTDRVRKFLNYFLPTTNKLVSQYGMLEAKGVQAELRGKIEAMLKQLETAYQKQLDSLYEDDVVDVTADIDVMQQMLESEGLLEDEAKF